MSRFISVTAFCCMMLACLFIAKGQDYFTVQPLATFFNGQVISTYPDGSYLIGGGQGIAAYISKLDSCGGMAWHKKINWNTNGAAGGRYYISRQRHIFYIMPAYWNSAVTNSNLIARLDSNGNVLWAKTYDVSIHSGGEKSRCLSDVYESGDGSVYVLANDYFSYNYRTDPTTWVNCLLKLDFKGDILWIKRYSTGHIHRNNSIAVLSDSNLLIHSAFFGPIDGGEGRLSWTKIDTSGHVIWSKTSANIAKTDTSQFRWDVESNIVPLPDGGFLSGGACMDSNYIARSFLMRFDKEGKILWRQQENGKDTASSTVAFIVTPQNKIVLYSATGSKKHFLETFGPLYNSIIAKWYFTELDLNGNILRTSSAPVLGLWSVCNAKWGVTRDHWTFINNNIIHKVNTARWHGCGWRPSSLTFKPVPVSISSENVSVSQIYWPMSNCTFTSSYLNIPPSVLCANDDLLPNDTSLCSGTSMELNVPVGYKGWKILWSTGAATEKITVSKTGKYWLRLSNNGCERKDTINIIIYKDITSVLPPQVTTCLGDSVLLDAGNPGIDFKWLTPHNNIKYGQKIYAKDSGYFRLRIAAESACQDIDTVKLMLYPKPQAYAGPDTIICYGTSFKLHGSGGETYEWTPAEYLDNAHIADPTSSTPVTQLYNMVTTSKYGCRDSAKVNLKVRPPLKISLQAPAGICKGESITLTAQASGGLKNNYTLRWLTADSQLISTAYAINVSPAKATNYIIILEDGCSKKSVLNFTLDVYSRAKAEFTATPRKGCAPLTVLFNASDSAAKYEWNFGDGTSGTGMSASHSYTTAGQYHIKLKVITSQGCTDSLQKDTLITVYPLPAVSFIADPEVTNILKPVISFRNTSVDVVSYNWNFGDTKVSKIKDPIHQYADTGYYLVQLVGINKYGCTDTALKHIHIKDLYSIYIPNVFSPNNDHLNDGFSPVITGYKDASIKIFNRWGEKVFEGDNKNVRWNGTYRGVTCQEGVYLYMLSVKDQDGGNWYYHGVFTLVR